MIPRPPNSTRTDTLFPAPTPFRSRRNRGSGAVAMGAVVAAAAGVRGARRDLARAVRSFAAAGDAGPAPARPARGDRKSVAQGKRVSVRVDLGGRRSIKKIQQIQKNIWCQSD